MKWVRKHYHWVIALLAFIEAILYGGLLNCASMFIIPISEGLQITRGTYALATVPYNLVCTASTAISGVLFQKLGYKRSSVLGLCTMALSLVVIASCQSVVGLCIGKILQGLTYGALLTAGTLKIIRDWFVKHRGLVVGAVSMSTGLGGSIMAPVLASLMDTYGWRTTYLILAGLMCVVAMAYVLLMKNHPENMGLQAYGFGTAPSGTGKSRTQTQTWAGHTFQEWLRRPMFYMMVVSTLITCIGVRLVSSAMVPHYTDLGFSSGETAAYQSLYMLVLAISKLLCGVVTDKFGAKPVAVICVLSAVVGQWLLSTVADPALCYVATILCGLSLSITTIVPPLLAEDLFGYGSIGNINSIVLGAATCSSLIATPAANLVFDYCGSYRPAFQAGALMNAAMIGVFLLMFAMAKKERKISVQTQ